MVKGRAWCGKRDASSARRSARLHRCVADVEGRARGPDALLFLLTNLLFGLLMLGLLVGLFGFSLVSAGLIGGFLLRRRLPMRSVWQSIEVDLGVSIHCCISRLRHIGRIQASAQYGRGEGVILNRRSFQLLSCQRRGQGEGRAKGQPVAHHLHKNSVCGADATPSALV